MTLAPRSALPTPGARFATLAAAALGAGCANLTGNCTDELRFGLSPAAPTLAVGESVTARADLRTCGGRRRVEDRVVWRSADPAVARVDSLSGRITGVAPGRTVVEARGDQVGPVPPGVQVTVR